MKYRHTTHLHGDYLDGDLTPDQKELVEGHLADCPDCRHDLAQLRKLTQAAKMVDIPDPADGYFDSLTETIMARTDGIVVEAPAAAAPDFRGRGRRVLMTLIKLAAAVTLLFTAFYISDFSQRQHATRWAEHIRKSNLATSGAESQDQMTPSAGINMFPGLPSPADPEDITDSAGTTGQ
jgi:anti-sigma factor RsiW